MNKNKLQQEQLCLQAKRLIDQLNTNLFMIEGLTVHDFKKYNKKLRRLKDHINSIYWNI